MSDKWTERLSEFLDGDLGSDDRTALERHLETCRECRDILADLETVKIRAGALQDTPPSAPLWRGIAERIGERVETEASDSGVPQRAGRRLAVSVPQLAAASIALMLLSGGTVQIFHASRTTEMQGPTVVEQASEPMVVPAGFDAMEYDRAITELEQVLRARRDQLAPSTVRILERNLVVIDQAIEDAWEALSQDPSNEYVNSHLARTMKQKIRLLRRATNMVSASS